MIKSVKRFGQVQCDQTCEFIIVNIVVDRDDYIYYCPEDKYVLVRSDRE